jgi:hypothetical protein
MAAQCCNGLLRRGHRSRRCRPCLVRMAVQPFMSKNAAQIRDILREQFDAESSRASDPSVAALFLELARTADDIPDVLADAYSEPFDDLYNSEIEMKMTWQMGIQWWPKNATAYVEKFISRASGGE